jgi:hypothetical protein
MKDFLLRNRVHLLIWALLLIYLPASYAVNERFLLKGPEPVHYDKSLPDPERARIKSQIQASAPDQKVMAVGGWAFVTNEMDQALYDRFVVLSSEKDIYLFPVSDLKRPDIHEKFKQFGMDLLQSGFGVQIPKERVPAGEYRLGILFVHKERVFRLYQPADLIVMRTPNYIKVQALPQAGK